MRDTRINHDVFMVSVGEHGVLLVEERSSRLKSAGNERGGEVQDT